MSILVLESFYLSFSGEKAFTCAYIVLGILVLLYVIPEFLLSLLSILSYLHGLWRVLVFVSLDLNGVGSNPTPATM